MPKKVFELAKELDMGAIELVEKLKKMGMNVRNHMVALQDDEVTKAMEAFAGGDESKPTTKKVTKKKVAKKKVVKKVVKKTTAKAKPKSEE
jgi:translation initiation factor IF-2